MTKFYYMLSALLFLQGIFGAMNVTVGEINDDALINFGGNNGGSGGNSNSTSTVFVCATGTDFCIGRDDPDHIIPKSQGKEKVEGVFSDITKLEGLENNKKGDIVEACDPNRLEKGKCQTRTCAVNEDCLSGLCQSGSCVTNPDNTLMECIANEDGSLTCAKYLQERCMVDGECFGRCKDFVCTYRYWNKLNTSPWLYYSSAILTALFFIALFCCCCCCPGLFHWEVKEKRNNNNPTPVV